MRNVIIALSLAFMAAACSGDDGDLSPNTPPSDATVASDATTVSQDGQSEAPGDVSSEDEDASAVGSDAQSSDVSVEDTQAPELDAVEDLSDAAVEDTTGPEADAEAPSEDVEESETTHDGTSTPDEDAATPDGDAGGSDPGSLLLCHILCDKVWKSCDEYAPFGSDQDSCVVACEEMTEASLDGLVVMSCVADSCDVEMCQPADGESLIQPLCQEACGLFESCGLMSVIQPDYPDELELCSIECSGGFFFDSEVMPVLVGCVIDGLSATCDPNVLEQCVEENNPGGGPGPGPQGPSCMEICDIATTFKCPPWSDGPDAWPDLSMCLEDCESFANDEASTAYTMYGCAMTSSCDAMGKCTTPPPSDDPGCEALCTKAFQDCGDIGMPSVDFCTDYCTGQLMVFGTNVSAEDGLACLEANALDCDQDPYAQVLGCLLDLESECTTICDAMVDCPTPNSLPVDECMPTCTAGYLNLFGALSTGETALCLEQVGDDCVEVEACIAPPMPPTCYGLCVSGTMCDPELDSCMSSCEAAVTAGKLADVSCEFANQCGDTTLCQGLEPGLNVQCVEACMAGPPNTCADQPEGCVAACHGLVTGSANNDPALPACISVELGASCSVDAAYWNCLQF